MWEYMSKDKSEQKCWGNFQKGKKGCLFGVGTLVPKEDNIINWIHIPFLEKNRHNCNGISFDWYNSLVFMKTGFEMKKIETQSDVTHFIEKHKI